MSQNGPYRQVYDLSNCDAEPLAFIRQIQEGALLFVVDAADETIQLCSSNTNKYCGRQPADLLGAHWSILFDPDLRKYIQDQKPTTPDIPILENPIHFPRWADGKPNALANLMIHYTDQGYLLELEPRDELVSSSEFLLHMDHALKRIQSRLAEDKALEEIARQTRFLTGFDRVMVYRFDHDYNGEVIAEEVEEDVHGSFLGVHFPHTDIPKQARELFIKNQIRQIRSTDPNAVAWIMSQPADRPLDLSQSANRGVSPIHLEYLQNMGVAASMSVAIVVGGKLWGLIACHHYAPRQIDYRLRSLIAFFGNVVSGHLALHQSQKLEKERLQSEILRARLFERMVSDYDIAESLRDLSEELIDLVDAQGAALAVSGVQGRYGKAPSAAYIESLIEWLNQNNKTTFYTNELQAHFNAEHDTDFLPAGLLALRLTVKSSDFLLWFRPEVEKTIYWGGRPDSRKQIVDGRVRLHPNISFQKFKEIVKGKSIAWSRPHIDITSGLRNDIKEIIMQKYQELKELNENLVSAYQDLESFSYTVSHDLRAPLRTIRGFTEILREDYSENFDEYGLSVLNVIEESVHKMNQYISDMLALSRISRGAMEQQTVDLVALIDDNWKQLGGPSSGVDLKLDLEVREMTGNVGQLNSLFQNFMSNAVKYRNTSADSYLHISTRNKDEQLEIELADNGIGFDPKHTDRVFQMFQRLVRHDDYEGTGIGLAIVKRVVENHSGTISVISQVGEGTTFTVAFPMPHIQ